MSASIASDPARLRLGFIVHFDGVEPVRRLYREHVELFVAAEELGFDVGWVAVRHFNVAAGGLPTAPVFLGAVAERTTRIRLGTAVTALPFEDPVRFAEDVAVLDALSDGRLELGVGSGPFPPVFSAFGLDIADRRALYQRTLARLKEALVGRPVLGRTWQATSDHDTIAATAAAGDGLMLQRFDPTSAGRLDAVQRSQTDHFLREWGDEARPPRVAVSRSVFSSTEADGGRRRLAAGLDRWVPPLVKAGLYPPDLGVDGYLERENLRYGTPESIADALRADLVLPLTTDLILGFQPAILTLDETVRQLETVATEIAPVLGWTPLAAGALAA